MEANIALVERTLAVFFGVVVFTCVQTPRRWGQRLSAGVLVFETCASRPLRRSC